MYTTTDSQRTGTGTGTISGSGDETANDDESIAFEQGSEASHYDLHT